MYLTLTYLTNFHIFFFSLKQPQNLKIVSFAIDWIQVFSKILLVFELINTYTPCDMAHKKQLYCNTYCPLTSERTGCPAWVPWSSRCCRPKRRLFRRAGGQGTGDVWARYGASPQCGWAHQGRPGGQVDLIRPYIVKSRFFYHCILNKFYCFFFYYAQLYI